MPDFLSQNHAREDDIIEKEDENYLDDAVKQLENSVYNICICAIEQLLNIFPQQSIQLIQILMQNLQQSKNLLF